MEKTNEEKKPAIDTSVPGLVSAFAFIAILGIAGFQASQWFQTLSPYHINPLLPKIVFALFFVITLGFFKRKEADAPWFINAFLFLVYSVFNYVTVIGSFKLQALLTFPPHPLFLAAFINLVISIIGFIIFYRKPYKAEISYEVMRSASFSINLLEGFDELPIEQQNEINDRVKATLEREKKFAKNSEDEKPKKKWFFNWT